MEKIKSVIIEDEPNNIILLKELLNTYCPEINIAGTAEDGMQGIELIKKLNPQLVFLDIEMPLGNAFDLLDKFEEIDFEIIFVTAYNNYALKAIKYEALDYILKPIDIEELKTAVKRAIKKSGERKVNDQVKTLLEKMKADKKGLEKIGLITATGFEYEDVNNILYIQARSSYCSISIKGKKDLLVSKTLKEVEETLPANIFCRIHHSYSVNVNHVKKFHQGRGGKAEMVNGKIFDISVRKKADFLKKLNHIS